MRDCKHVKSLFGLQPVNCCISCHWDYEEAFDLDQATKIFIEGQHFFTCCAFDVNGGKHETKHGESSSPLQRGQD
jgi:hypothetical protein